MPCLRHRSAVPSPAFCSFKIAMICSSLNLLRFMHPPSVAADSTKIWRRSRGSGQLRLKSDHFIRARHGQRFL